MSPPPNEANFLPILRDAAAVEADTFLGAINFRRQSAKKKLLEEHVLDVAHHHGLLLEPTKQYPHQNNHSDGEGEQNSSYAKQWQRRHG